MCVCVCVCEREREREGVEGGEREKEGGMEEWGRALNCKCATVLSPARLTPPGSCLPGAAQICHFLSREVDLLHAKAQSALEDLTKDADQPALEQVGGRWRKRGKEIGREGEEGRMGRRRGI